MKQHLRPRLTLFPPPADDQLVPLLTAREYVLLRYLAMRPALACEVLDAKARDRLVQLGLAEIDRRTDRLSISDDGQAWLYGTTTDEHREGNRRD